MLNLSSLLKVQGHSQGFCSAVECRNCSAVAARGETEDRVSVDFAVAKRVRPREEEKLEIATSTIVMTKSYLFSIVLKYFYGAALAESSQVDMDGLFVCVSMQTGLPKFSSNTRLLHASEWNSIFPSGRLFGKWVGKTYWYCESLLELIQTMPASMFLATRCAFLMS